MSELQQKMALGLESKEGALRALGEEFPEEKMEEIRQEMIEDAKADGALSLIKVQIQKEIMDHLSICFEKVPNSDSTVDGHMRNVDVRKTGQATYQQLGRIKNFFEITIS
jgi:hypothetical protein